MTDRSRETAREDRIRGQFVQTVCRRLAENKPVRRTLPVWGRLHIDRQLPFLCVYRRPVVRDDAGTERLVTSEAAYLMASAAGRLEPGLQSLARSIVETLAEPFGAFLLMELWSGVSTTSGEDLSSPGAAQGPGFRIFVPWECDPSWAQDSLNAHLESIRIAGHAARVTVSRSARWSASRLAPLLTAAEARSQKCNLVGLEVAPIYRDPRSGEVYPVVLRRLRRALTRALRRSFYDFVRSRTSHLPEHYHVLGRRALVKAVWEADRQLAEVSNSFDLLLQSTPVNSRQAWREFERSRFQRTPKFRYRPLRVDPVVLKRRLFAAPVEKIEDPALMEIFRENQDELDRRITMLHDIDTPRFLHGSRQVHGEVGDRLLRTAEEILTSVPSRARNGRVGPPVDAETFAGRARAEIRAYRKQWSGLKTTVQIREDMPSGLMVSHGKLLIGAGTKIPASRVEALLQHEIGTHVLTYCNGRAQNFHQLCAGLAGYDALQEGLAVLAEYLVGGLNRSRLRVLAGRVVTVRHLTDGASFVDAFRDLRSTHGFSAAGAFSITTRVYRAGGLTKDAVYLRGLTRLLEYLRQGGRLDPLIVGKIAVEHVPIIRELRLRGVLRDPPLRPRYLDLPEARDRLRRLREGATVHDLVREEAPRGSEVS